jgi:hypothetical protein
MGKKSVVVSLTTDNKVTTSYRNFSLAELEQILARPALSFLVEERPAAVGGGWKLTLFEGKEEMGGGVFPAGDDGYSEAYDVGFHWQYRGV